jgi:O-antigen/teichoic acid export membrane protein
MAVSAVWPFLLETDIPYWTIFGVVFLQGVSGVITYWYTSTVVNFLMASGKNYINNYVHLLTSLITYGFKIIICLTKLDIVYMALSLIAVSFLKCLVYYGYLKWQYPEYAIIQREAKKQPLRQRNSFLLHEISGVVFSSTDTIILSVFCGLKEASVYAVYALVLNALRMIIGQAFNSTSYMLGNSYSKEPGKYHVMHDKYNLVYTSAVFVVFTIAYWMILPFISVYTQGIMDTNYLDPNLPILFVLIELLSACRIVDGQLIKNAYHSKQTLCRSMIEAAINLCVSLAAVQYLRMYGVLLGTIVALLYRTNDIIIYANTKILKRSPLREYAVYAVNGSTFILFVVIAKHIQLQTDTYFQCLLQAGMVSVVVLLVYTLINSIMYKTILKPNK